MKSAMRIILAGLFVPALAATAGCSKSAAGPNRPSSSSGSTTATAPVARPANLPNVPVEGARAELETIRSNYDELRGLCVRNELPFRTIEAKAWLVASSANTLLKSAAAAGHLQEGKPEPDWLVDLDLISIDSTRLGYAAAIWDGPVVRENFGKLDLACKRLFPAPPATPPATPPLVPQGAGKK